MGEEVMDASCRSAFEKESQTVGLEKTYASSI